MVANAEQPREDELELELVREPRACSLCVATGLLLFGFAAVVCITGATALSPTDVHSSVKAAVRAAGRRLEQDPFNTKVVGEQLKESSWQVGATHLIQVIIAVTFACMYKHRVVDQVTNKLKEHRPTTGHDDFGIGLFDCLWDFNYCLMVCACPEVRQAHTNEVAGVCGFWHSIMLMIFGSICLAPCCGPCCINVYFRMHLKDMLGLEDHCINDFCVALFCWPCAVGQQAMAIDDQLGYHVKCCCNLQKVSHSRHDPDPRQMNNEHQHFVRDAV